MDDILVLIYMVPLLPLAFVGVYKIMDTVFEKMRVKMGYVRIYLITKSFRLRHRLMKPSGGKINIEKGKPVPFENKPPFMAFDGSTPVTVYNHNGTQLNMLSDKTKNQIDADYFSNLVTESYNLGILSAIKQSNVVKLFLIIAIVAAAIAAAMGFVNWQSIQEVVSKVAA